MEPQDSITMQDGILITDSTAMSHENGAQKLGFESSEHC